MAVATIQIDDVEYLQTADVARELGLTVDAVNKAIQRGTLRPTKKIGIYNLFHPADIQRYRDDHLGKRGGTRRTSPN
jgi:DNA-binding transcriptional MerR regulator